MATISFQQLKSLRDVAFQNDSKLNDWEKNYVRRKTDLPYEKLEESELNKLAEARAKVLD